MTSGDANPDGTPISGRWVAAALILIVIVAALFFWPVPNIPGWLRTGIILIGGVCGLLQIFVLGPRLTTKRKNDEKPKRSMLPTFETAAGDMLDVVDADASDDPVPLRSDKYE